ncbi:MAG: M36 family metallopeptidase [Bacteroidota bacterium]
MMNNNYNKIPLYAFFLLLLVGALQSTAQSPLETAMRYIEQHRQDWQLEEADIADLAISSSYTTKSLNAQHLYLIQRHQGIEVFNAMITLTIDQEGKVYQAGHQLIADLVSKVNTTQAQISAETALYKAAGHRNILINETPRLLQQKGNREFIFDKGHFSEEDVKVKLCYFPMEDGRLRLAWDLAIRDLKSSDFPNIRVDALDGSILDEDNWTHYSTSPKHAYRNLDRPRPQRRTDEAVETLPKANTTTAGQYNVFALPVESPAHGSRSLISNPDDATASPFGWHDTNASSGPEYTITRGNNVHAYHDADGNNFSDNDEPDGGASLVFNYPYNSNDEPNQYRDAAVTNLFYTCNFMHDFAYRYGFDEVAGNFQQNNYGNGGFENDYIRVEAQDGSGVNNAQFSTGPEGSKGRMEMFLWDRNAGGQRVVQVDAPEIVAGLYEAGLADFGPAISNTPITGEVVIVDDGINQSLSTDACESDFVNGNALNGKIALVDRGGCDYEQKTVNAEAYGAIAVIVCDFNPEPNFMNGVPGIPNPGIPTVRLGAVDCQKIRVHAGSGLQVTLKLPPETGPDLVDSDFDNGAIIHEYTHGISERLTGGPNTVTCLNNLEQMGEGWSDFFALAATVQAGDDGSMRRGLATYLFREDTDGNGVRNYPYSTDMTINPLTYRDIGNEIIPHGLGAVWASVLWDMYWALVEEYGWSADLIGGNAGNNRAIQLVMDGMKMQTCDPGFVNARDAILMADEIRYGGENLCLLWEVFARRGLGWEADQGDNDGVDAIESFEPFPLCVEEIKIAKRSSPITEAGANFNIFIDVYNHKPGILNEVVVVDELPDGLTFTGNSTWPATVNGNQITFELNDMAYLDTIQFFYQVSSSPDKFSIQKQIYNAETEDFWDPVAIAPTNNPGLFWQLSGTQKYTGDFSWYVPNTSAEVRQQLVLKEPITITGNNPALRFYHRYRTQPGVDGGVVEISTSSSLDGAIFEQLGDAMIRNGYPGFVQYTTFIIPNLLAYTGNVNTFVDTYVDLNAYKNESVYLRFNFASSAGGSPPGGGYWYVDDIELMDLFAYDGEACATYNGGPEVCAKSIGGGTIVQSKISTSAKDLDRFLDLNVFPNPASQSLYASIKSEEPLALQLSLVAIDGREIMRQKVQSSRAEQLIEIDVSQIPVGMYFLKTQHENAVHVEKIIIE